MGKLIQRQDFQYFITNKQNKITAIKAKNNFYQIVQYKFISFIKKPFQLQRKNMKQIFLLIMSFLRFNKIQNHFYFVIRFWNMLIIHMIKLLIFIHFVLTSLAQQCTPIIQAGSSVSVIPGFESRSVSLQNTGTKQRQIIFNVPLQQSFTTKAFQVIPGIVYIENYFDPQMFDFAIRANPDKTQFTLIFFMNVQASWKSVHVHYIVTTRSDFRVGSFVGNNPELLQINKLPSRLVKVSYNLGSKKWTDSNFAESRAYINGIKYKQVFLDIQISKSTYSISENSIEVTLNITNQKFLIEALHIGYVIFTKVNSPLIIRFISSIQSTLFKNLLDQENQYVSITKLNSNQLFSLFQINKGKRLLAGLTIFSQAQFSKFTDAFQLEGMLVQGYSQLAADLPTLQQGTSGIFQNGNCTSIAKCIQLGGYTIIQNGQKKCILCRPNSQYDLMLERCICSQNYFNDEKGNCISFSSLCANGQLYLNGSCYILSSQIIGANCSQNEVFNLATKQCVCVQGFLTFVKNGIKKCAQPCLKGEIFDIFSEKCVCFSGIYDVNRQCVSCQGLFSKWNPQKNECQCLPGSQKFLGQCSKCSQQASYNQKEKKCICKQNYSGNGVVCRLNSLRSGIKIVFSEPPKV